MAAGVTQVTSALGPGGTDSTVEMIHRITLFQRAGMLGGASFTGEIKRAMATKELLAAYRLVHNIYVQEGYILPHPNGIRIRLFEAFPEMATFVGEFEGQVVGVMGIVPDSPSAGLPSDKAFRSELDDLRAQGLKVCEVTNLALNPGFRRTSLFFDLARACYAQTRLWGCDQAFVSICPKHRGFFRDVLHFAPCGDERSYSDDLTDIVVGMAMNIRTVEQQFVETDQLLGDNAFLHNSFHAGNHFHDKCRRWSREAQKAFSDAGLLTELFVKSGFLLGKATAKELETVRRWWGEELFSSVYREQLVGAA